MKIPLFVMLALGWCAAVVGGLGWIDQYMAAPGEAAVAQTQMTAKTGKWRFVLVVASYCPCSRASLSGLKAAVESHPESTVAEVVFFDHPKPDNWFYQEAKSIRNCQISTDKSDRNGARTSGQAFLYNPDGELVYSGGLTQGRGVDDSRFAMKLYDDYRNHTGTHNSGPVFGCDLTEETK